MCTNIYMCVCVCVYVCVYVLCVECMPEMYQNLYTLIFSFKKPNGKNFKFYTKSLMFR